MNNNPIGVLDSGVGGLTVWQAIAKELPQEATIYIGDSANAPYGKKSAEEIYMLAKKLITFLLEKDAKLIVVACNTITVNCIEQLRKSFPNTPIIGTVPVVKTAGEKTKNKRIGILATAATIRSPYNEKLIAQFAAGCTVTRIGTNNIVPLIEKGIKGTQLTEVLQKELEPFVAGKVDVVVLGSTHFPLIAKEIQKVLGKDLLILDSGGAIARQVKRILTNNNALASGNKPSYDFYTTGEVKRFKPFLSSRAHSINSVRGDLPEKKIAVSPQ